MSDEPRPADRKPEKMRWETWVERKIRESIERGEFDNLPGAGKPLPDLDRPYDELWWLRKKLREEQFSIEPPLLELRRQFDQVQAQIAAARSETEVRRLVAAINERIVYVNTHTTSGPATELAPLAVERVVAQWRQGRSNPGGGSAAGSAG